MHLNAAKWIYMNIPRGVNNSVLCTIFNVYGFGMARSIFKIENKTWNNDTDIEKAVYNLVMLKHKSVKSN